MKSTSFRLKYVSSVSFLNLCFQVKNLPDFVVQPLGPIAAACAPA